MVGRDLTPDGLGIGGGIMGAMLRMEDYPGHVTVYVEVPDVEAACQNGGTTPDLSVASRPQARSSAMERRRRPRPGSVMLTVAE